MTIRCSIIIPVFNRPDELKELLESLHTSLGQIAQNQSQSASQVPLHSQPQSQSPSHTQSHLQSHSLPQSPPLSHSRTGSVPDTKDSGISAGNVEVIVVEDGSTIRSEDVCLPFKTSLNLRYLSQENAGPAAARNTGAKSARGDWLIFFDSDCLIPEGYFEAVSGATAAGDIDFFGGPDRASADFTAVQKAIDYAMTSFLTTGGIRGGKKKLDRYYPRSFNMGVRRDAFDKVNGFSGLRFGEDLDLSMRLMEAGFRSVLIGEAWVYHKRRTNLKKFFKQVYNSGMARIVLNRLHPGTLKAVHLLPTLLVFYLAAALVTIPVWSFILWVPIVLLLLFLFADGLNSTGELATAMIVPVASMVQLIGYGTGLAHAFFLVYLFGQKEANAFKETFYK